MSIESFMTANFSNYAKEQERRMRGKRYKYALLDNSFSNVIKEGECFVNSRRYDLSIDCDILTVTDCDTQEKFSANQFVLNLKEVKEGVV